MTFDHTRSTLTQSSHSPRTGLLATAALLLALTTGQSGAHDDAYLDQLTGPNGGQLRVAGLNHFELVVSPPPGAPASEQPVAVYLTDHADQPTASAGFSGRAVILANRERVEVALLPDGDNRLSGQARFAHDPDMVVVVTLTLPDQTSAQARFTPYKHLDGSPRTAPAEAASAAEQDAGGDAHHQHH